MSRLLKYGDKVRHKESNMEGKVAYSRFGFSVNGFTYREDNDQLIHFKTLGMNREELESQWKRIYKWKYDMLRYEKENQQND